MSKEISDIIILVVSIYLIILVAAIFIPALFNVLKCAYISASYECNKSKFKKCCDKPEISISVVELWYSALGQEATVKCAICGKETKGHDSNDYVASVNAINSWNK
jgi:hypothetical protein